MTREVNKAVLLLEDGTHFEGRGFGARGTVVGEVVFNTAMTGYQEILTDPSYNEQIVTMTYPLIGNYGTNGEDIESRRPFVRGFVVKENCPFPSNWRHGQSLDDYLRSHGIVGLEGIDTRRLVRHIRERGAMRGIISSEATQVETLRARLAEYPGLVGRNIVQDVTVEAPFEWDEPVVDVLTGVARKPPVKYRVVGLDFGIKYNILRLLRSHGCAVTVVPAATDAASILKMDPDGIFLSNGPGDPAPVAEAIETIRELLGIKPIFGICLGHQLLSLALGAKTYKLKFGHHGANHPVKNLDTGAVEITSQNHGFCVDPETLPKGVEVTHVNLNDQTNEGIRCVEKRAFSVQYHPEASPGPHDSAYLFETFTRLMDATQ